MGTSYYLVCEQCKTYLWAGQHFAAGRNVLYETPDALEALRSFLYTHAGHALTFTEEGFFVEWLEVRKEGHLNHPPAAIDSETIDGAPTPPSAPEIRVWAEPDGPIMLRVVTEFGDPVELNGTEARLLARRLTRLAQLIDE